MSAEQDKPETKGTQPEAAAEDGGGGPKDLPIPVVIVAIVLAAAVFGLLGWKRYQAMREEALRQMYLEQQRAFQEGVADAHRRHAEREAADDAQSAPEDAASAQTQTAPTQP